MARKTGLIWILGLLAFCGAAGEATAQQGPPVPRNCPSDAIVADVVAIDHPMVFNRIGAQNVNWMMYALRHDLIDVRERKPLDYGAEGERLFARALGDNRSRGVALRPDLRPRPIVLRVPAKRHLYVRLTNLLIEQPAPPNTTTGNPYTSSPDPLGGQHPMDHAAKDHTGEPRIFHIDDQVFSRRIGFHPQGLELYRIDDDSSYVGNNADSMVGPGKSREYCFYAPAEGAFLVNNPGAAFGGEGSAGDTGVGLFGAVTVQPEGAKFYRAQVTEEEMRLATRATTQSGQPVVNYEQAYPDDCASGGVWCQEGKAGLPILNMLDKSNRLIHSDVNAIVMGGQPDGSFDASTYPLEKDGRRNPTLPNRLEPFREFVSIYHDENAATQTFPYFFEHPELGHTLHGVRDAFMINYGSGGVGGEIVANRLKAGPMQDCLDCAYEEFFLSAFAVGDAALLVDKPINLAIGRCQPEFVEARRRRNAGESYNGDHDKGFDEQCTWTREDVAGQSYYPHDPANVHHSYIGDFVKFRNIHAGKEQHIFHLHNHQWLFNPNDDNSNYIDAQGIGPGSGYTYEIAFGGSGNRNKTVGDAVFHCHFYPHFAQGMWYMWRNHDVMETGTPLAVSQTSTGYHRERFELMNGRPAEKARALPDGEILSGTPIPAIVPLPGKPLPPMPEAVQIVADGDGLGSKAVLASPGTPEAKRRNPGYPFWVAGVTEHDGVPAAVGHRPTTPPLDMTDAYKDPETGVVREMGGFDGGLPRHALAGYAAGGADKSELTRMSAAKKIERARPIYFAEKGTPLEQLAMRFHATRSHATYRFDVGGTVSDAKFVVNGAPPVPGAPYNEPCIDDNGRRLFKGATDGQFFGGKSRDAMIGVKDALPGGIEYGADNPRVYKGANIQLDVTFNKLGYHYPQQRILALWDDVDDTLKRKRPPEPLVLRMNTFDCAMYQHTNLVPKDFFADDYQITTPTDVIGQHIHLPKWDLTSADGSANGWNYEDGTFSPDMVRERVSAINHWNTDQEKAGKPTVATLDGTLTLVPKPHPYFGKAPHQNADCVAKWNEVGGDFEAFQKKYGAFPGVCDWLGARTTLQRWFSDPMVNSAGFHRGLGITFTHDHLGPSTHQQLGLYATMLTEPPGSRWFHNETGKPLYDGRHDGGPTSWQAIIANKDGKPIDVDGDRRDDAHREFFLQFGDFQHAYLQGVYIGVTSKGMGSEYDSSAKPTANSFRDAIHPSVRKPASSIKDIVKYDDHCPGGPDAEKLEGAVYTAGSRPPRPCPEAISADDVGMMVVNYRNEPVAARVYDPKSKSQTAGFAGDLGYAFQSRTDRAIQALNTQYGSTSYGQPLTEHVLRGDPFTPTMRAYAGDMIRVKVQAGSHEHEHNGTINGLAWLQGGSGFGQAPHSGWRNAQNAGLSEQFTFAARIVDYATANNQTDRLYTIDTGQDGLWSGVWGVLRSSNRRNPLTDKLQPLPSNPRPSLLLPGLGQVRLNDCPAGARVRSYHVAAVLANAVLPNALQAKIDAAAGTSLNADGGTLVYNPRNTAITVEIVDDKGDPTGKRQLYGHGPLHDPTAILFVREEDLGRDGRLRSDRPVEPLVLRAAAGECVQVVLHNRLPKTRALMPDLDGYTSLSGFVRKNGATAGSEMTTFNNNDVRPSNYIGLHPQMVHYDVQAHDGSIVGVNKSSLIGPGGSYVYQWYAGALETVASADACPIAAQAQIDVALQDLNVFPRRPDLRPLGQLYDEARFRENAERLLTREAARDEATLDALVKSAIDADCLEKAGDEDAFASGEGRALDAADVLQKDDVFDRMQVYERRRVCASDPAKVRSPFARDVSGKVRDPNAFAAELAGNILYETAGVDADADAKQALSWRLDRYEDLVASSPERTTDTTRLVTFGNRCRFVPVEFGGSNLTPPDRIKQGQKAAVGALIVEPQDARWNEFYDDTAIDRQNPGIAQRNVRATRATANVEYPVNAVNGNGGTLSYRPMRDLAIVHQKGLNFRYGEGGPVQNLAAEREDLGVSITETAPEDAQDAGHMAINYGSEPLWFRFGLAPDAPFGRDGFGGATDAWQAFSNGCCGGTGTAVDAPTQPVGQPYVPIMTAPAGTETRLRVLMPTGIGRATIFSQHGHAWPRDPYLAERVSATSFPVGGRPFDWGTPARCIGGNPMEMFLGGQESVTPMAHYDMVLASAGGTHAVAGDYLWRDMGGFGISNGLWGILRVTPSPDLKRLAPRSWCLP